MIEIEHQRTVALPADRVWQEMRQFDRVLQWVPGGAESTIEVSGSGVGMVRNIQLVTMGYVQHRLLALDDDQRSFAYTLTGGKPLGMQSYQVTATVTSIDPEHCRIAWLGEMTGDGSLDEAEIGQALEMALANMTTGIVAVVMGERPDFTRQLGVDY